MHLAAIHFIWIILYTFTNWVQYSLRSLSLTNHENAHSNCSAGTCAHMQHAYLIPSYLRRWSTKKRKGEKIFNDMHEQQGIRKRSIYRTTTPEKSKTYPCSFVPWLKHTIFSDLFRVSFLEAHYRVALPSWQIHGTNSLFAISISDGTEIYCRAAGRIKISFS